MDRTDEELLETIADLHGIPEGSFNIRKNGKLLARHFGYRHRDRFQKG